MDMLHDEEIVCFGPSDWWAMNPSCTSHIMQRLAKQNKVLYINPFSSDLLGAAKRGLAKRLIRKLKSTGKFLKKPQDNLHVFSPVFLPFQGNRIIDAFNNLLLRFQINMVCSFLKVSRPILWIENIRAAEALEWFDPVIVVYHVSDLFEECGYTANREILRKREQKVIERSDILICVSKKLYNKKAKQGNNVFYLPHGVDFELFRQAANNGNHSFEKLADVPRPIVGYYGTLTNHNDIELLSYCAAQLRDVSFVFAGQVTGGNYQKLAEQSNVYFLGKLPYSRIPHLCASFNVCLLPWKMNKWIRFCNPLKSFEYMASGKPIVSVPIDEIVDNYSDIVSVAKTKRDYCNAIAWELNNDTLERSQRRIEVAGNHTWAKHLEQLSQIISGAIAAKKE
jgi:glycosyltransferase involved in cell wall biosynthesis